MALTIAAATAAFPPNFAANYSMWAAKLHEDLLDGYVKSVPPTSHRIVDYSAAGTDVALQIRMLKVREVSPSEGYMTIKVWWRMWWTDLRLAWDPSEYGGVSEIRFLAESFAAAEVSEIWLPDIQPYNAIEGMMHTFDPSLATVKSDGTVSWSRPGNLNVLCRFSGLIMFPYGLFSCPVEVGGWATGGGHVGLRSADLSVTSKPGCADFSATEEIALPSYQEISFVKVECTENTYEYALAPNDPFPVIVYRIYLQRAGSFYTLWTMIPSTLFTILSFGVFFMSFEVGERLGIGVTLVLTIEVSRGALQAVMPICGEWLWIEIFFFLNLIYTIASLLESCIVLGFAYCQEETLLPEVVRKRLFPSHGSGGDKKKGGGDDDQGSLVGRFLDNQASRMGRVLKRGPTSLTLSNPPPGPSHARVPAEVGGGAQPTPPPSPPADDGAASASPRALLAEKLIFFENLFFQLDVDGGGTITFEEMRKMLAFTALAMSSDEREAALRAADTDNSDGKLTRYEFMDLCVAVLRDEPLESLEHAAASYAEFRAALKRRSNAYWRRVADRIDRVARFWIPLSYVTFVALILSVEFKDQYTSDTLDRTNTSTIDAAVEMQNAVTDGVATIVPMKEMLEAATIDSEKMWRKGWFGIFVVILSILFVVVRCSLIARERWLETHNIEQMKQESTTLKRYETRRNIVVAKNAPSSAPAKVQPIDSSRGEVDKVVDF